MSVRSGGFDPVKTRNFDYSHATPPPEISPLIFLAVFKLQTLIICRIPPAPLKEKDPRSISRKMFNA